MRPLSERSGLEPTITNSLTDRSSDTTENSTTPSYVFVRAHDSEVQTVIAQIIKDQINPNTDGYTFTLDELKQAFEIYNEDEKSTDKKYTQFNLPSAYAIMLSDKDVVPRVYYGDLYTDNGQYMATKTPYYDAITSMLKARIKYVAGGQSMKISYVLGTEHMAASDYRGVLASVRYGLGAMTANDTGDELTRTSGMAVITSNSPNLILNSDEKITVNMGAAHKNQAYRALLMTTDDGIATYDTDADTPSSLIKYTDENGNLTFDSTEIKGYSNPQVSGFLAVWVPVGASDDQDVRTESSDATNTDGQTYHSNAALDSQLIYEGFSNFQDFVESDSQYMNKVVAQNTDLFKSWGVTSFELPPQYVSSTDGTFLDSIIQNGYAFSDRYDIAMSKNNKYGSKQDLVDALKALHKSGIQAIADWVPDQIYSLPGEEVVTATRVNNYGIYRDGSQIKDTLYVANTKSKDDYQQEYGGAFLEMLKANYPSIFDRVQISSGEKIDGDTKITNWKAEYFNGTNILNRGAEYVLHDGSTNQYYNVNESGGNLPFQLTLGTVPGFYQASDGSIHYRTSNGNDAINTLITDENGNLYGFDANGKLLIGEFTIDNNSYYALQNGLVVHNAIVEKTDANGETTYSYYNKFGILYDTPGYFQDVELGKWRYILPNKTLAVGLIKLDDGNYQYFDIDGYQIKGAMVDGRYFDANSGNALRNQFSNIDGNWYYFGDDGKYLTGLNKVGDQTLYFDAEGKQVKGDFATVDGKLMYFDLYSGDATYSMFRLINGNWYYFDETGNAVRGFYDMYIYHYYFDPQTGIQSKGKFTTLENGQVIYTDPNSGDIIMNQLKEIDGKLYSFDKQGYMLRNQFEEVNGSWYYFTDDGSAATGSQTINGQQLYFDENGRQAKGIIVTDNDGRKQYYDVDTGDLVKNRFIEYDGSWYYFGSDGYAVTGLRRINRQTLYFRSDGTQVKGDWVQLPNGRYAYFDKDTGNLKYKI